MIQITYQLLLNFPAIGRNENVSTEFDEKGVTRLPWRYACVRDDCRNNGSIRNHDMEEQTPIGFPWTRGFRTDERRISLFPGKELPLLSSSSRKSCETRRSTAKTTRFDAFVDRSGVGSRETVVNKISPREPWKITFTGISSSCNSFTGFFRNSAYDCFRYKPKSVATIHEEYSLVFHFVKYFWGIFYSCLYFIFVRYSQRIFYLYIKLSRISEMIIREIFHTF